MCGLYASIRFEPDEKRIDIVAHRGPDGRGWREFSAPAGPVALGHRRLAIIDLRETGLQPMADPTGRFHLVFNGEIYNFHGLREEMRARGEIFRTETDSEVLLRGYALWGESVLDKLEGMFAFLIWDNERKTLFAARDRFGIKPLYVVANAWGIAFASEIKQLLGLRGLSGRMNVNRVYDFALSGHADHTDETMYDGIYQLRGGECAMVDASSDALKPPVVRRWYAIGSAGGLSLSEEEAASRFRQLLSDSVASHLRSDVPVGSCLSGGLDSSSIVCLMAQKLDTAGGGRQVKTVSACYSDKSVDEKPFIDAVVAHTGAQPNYVFPRAEDVFERASDITWHQDEPFGSSSIFAQWCVFEEARRAGIKVMLDGQGADEQLAGYHGCFSYYVSDLVRRGRLMMLLRTVWERHRMHGLSLSGQLRQFIPFLPPMIASRIRQQQQAWVMHDWLGSEVFGPHARPPALEVARERLDLPPVTDIATMCLAFTHAFNLQLLLHWEDRNSMAHSIEARVPFLDHRLVEFSLALGNDHKIVGGDTKRVLRRAMRGILPDSVRQRRDKLGFATPEQAWFRGPLRELVRDGIETTLRVFPGLLNADGTRALAKDMLDGLRPVDFTLWRIVNLGMWGQRFRVTI